MRKQLFTLAFAAMALLFTAGLHAQVKTPSASPTMKMETTIGLTDFHVTYSRPGVKGRKIFATDGLVPYGEIWRTGANQATKFTFSDKVTIAGAELAAGDYAVLTKPMADKWEVMFYTYETGNWGSYVKKAAAATVSADVFTMPAGVVVESFSIDVQDQTMDGANIMIMWDNTIAILPVKTNAKEAVMAQIDQMMAGPGMNDYYQAASFLSESGSKDKMKDALTYIQKANKLAGDDQKYWMVRREGIILESLGMKKEAKAAFTKSMGLAKTAGNMDYVRLNEASLKMLK